MQSAEHQRKLLENAGFVDIQVIEKVMDLGCYSQGNAIAKRMLTAEDQISRQAGILARYPCDLLFRWMEPKLVPEESSGEATKASDEMKSGAAPVAFGMYLPIHPARWQLILDIM
jgi:hypothetical protein